MTAMSDADLTSVDPSGDLGTTEIPAGRELLRLEGVTKILGGHAAVRDVSMTVEAGQVVSGGSGWVFRMAQNGEMELRARMAQTDMAQLSAGVPATVTPVGSSS